MTWIVELNAHVNCRRRLGIIGKLLHTRRDGGCVKIVNLIFHWSQPKCQQSKPFRCVLFSFRFFYCRWHALACVLACCCCFFLCWLIYSHTHIVVNENAKKKVDCFDMGGLLIKGLWWLIQNGSIFFFRLRVTHAHIAISIDNSVELHWMHVYHFYPLKVNANANAYSKKGVFSSLRFWRPPASMPVNACRTAISTFLGILFNTCTAFLSHTAHSKNAQLHTIFVCVNNKKWP